MTEARVILNWACNLDCEYCCNKIPAIKEQFKPLPDPEILEQYDVIKISGGEPTLFPTRIQELLRWLKPSTKVYLYSNGYDVQAWLDFYEHGGWGVTYTPHSDIDWEAIKTVRAYGFPLRVRLKAEIAVPAMPWLLELGCTVDVFKVSDSVDGCEVDEDRLDASETIF